jgi:hypothetical protein
LKLRSEFEIGVRRRSEELVDERELLCAFGRHLIFAPDRTVQYAEAIVQGHALSRFP